MCAAHKMRKNRGHASLIDYSQLLLFILSASVKKYLANLIWTPIDDKNVVEIKL
jgi:hypothetical protein